MSPQGGRKITFNILEMLQLRIQGWSTISLGAKYNRDHTTILYHCKKYGIEPGKLPIAEIPNIKFTIDEPEEFTPKTPPKIYKYAHLFFNEKINEGKSYREYIDEVSNKPEYRIFVAIAPRDTKTWGTGGDPAHFAMVPDEL